MKVFYNPSFTGNAYVDFSKSPVLFDTKIVNTAGLCGIIRLHAGICSEVKDYGTRFVDYYAAMKKFMAKNPDNVMAASFEIDKLNTAKKCLEWRDTLAAAGWTGASPAPTERMKVLAGVEEFFHDKSAGEELLELIAQIEGGCPLPELEIITSSYYEDFTPAEVRLLKALIERGVSFSAKEEEPANNNISKIHSVLKGEEGITLDPKDDSFEIWNFAERDEAIKYLSLLDAEDFDVWINADNKEFDNWQKLEGKRLSGSQISGIPHTAQLLNIALTIFERPLNVYNIVEWLNTSPNPLSPGFRSGLASRICSSGGFYNDTCRRFIEESIAKYPDSAKNIQKFLPDINKPVFEEGEVEVAAIKEFVTNLSNWCIQKLSQNKEDAPAIEQLRFVVNQGQNLLLLLEELGTETIPYEDIARITSAFTTDQSMSQYAAQAGSKKIITSYADFCDTADKTVWCDFYNCGDSGRLTYSYLVPAEQDAYKNVLQLWDTGKERNYLKNILLTPFARTSKKLVLVTLDKIGSETAPKSPLYIQLEKYFADNGKPNEFTKNKLFPFVKQMKLDDTLFEEVHKVDNRMESEQEFVEIKNTDYIKDNWPDHQSSSNLEKIMPWPLEYVINTFAGFTANAVDSLSDVFTVKGNVAHKIIQTLFGPVEGVAQSGTPTYIKKQIEERFEQIFEQTVQAEGAVLLTKDNKAELRQYKKDLKYCLEQLLNGISANNLVVVACENEMGYLKEKGEVIRHGKIGILDIKAFVDMILKDKDNNYYIFDFKWSSVRKYAKKLKENKSVQLSLYKELLNNELKASGKKSEVKGVAYFIMPDARFVSYNKLEGDINLDQIYIESKRKTSNLLKEIQNTYTFRKEQIFEGKLEETGNWDQGTLEYEGLIKDKELMPVDYYEIKTEHAIRKSGPYPDANMDLLKDRK